MLLVSLNPPGVTTVSFQLRVSDSASSNLRPQWLLRLLNGQSLCETPGPASISINEWVSLWDHCTVRGLGPHHTHQFLNHLRKPKPARRSLLPFLQSKALMYFPHFYPDKFYNGSQTEERCQMSLLLKHSAKTIRVPYNGVTSASFSRGPGIPRFFPN